MQDSDTLFRKSAKNTHPQGAKSFNSKRRKDSQKKIWHKTGKDNLVRHRSGVYYARIWAGGREIWRSLKTTHFSIAQARLAEFLKEHRQRVGNGVSGGGKDSKVSAKMTFSEAALLHLRNLDNDVRLKPRTRSYYAERLKALEKSWPRLTTTEIRKITQFDCRDWAGRYGKTASAPNYNNTLSLLRHIFGIAIEAGVIYANPAAALKRAPLRGKQIALPSTEQFNALIDEMRAGHGRYSLDCADFAAGLAFTGCRKGEANALQWRDIDFAAGEIVVRGDAVTGTKGGEGWRRVPLIADARALFERMRGERANEPLDGKVFQVRECQKAIDRACQKIGAARITHHDLRHLFATRCIESGVDIPTVSRWLGHKDGGALLMKTYGHLRREHSIAQAAKVSFAVTSAKQADVIPFSVEA